VRRNKTDQADATALLQGRIMSEHALCPDQKY
jgi:hypothetical protein